MRIDVAVAFLALLGCSDALAPVTIGAPYRLQTVNGHPLPSIIRVYCSARSC